MTVNDMKRTMYCGEICDNLVVYKNYGQFYALLFFVLIFIIVFMNKM